MKLTEEMVRFREVALEEIRALYPRHDAMDNGDGFVLRPATRLDGPIFLELPKTLPVDEQNRLIDLTRTARYCSSAHLGQILGIKLAEIYGDVPILLRWGKLREVECRTPLKAGSKRYRLRLGEKDGADAIQLIIAHTAPVSWMTPEMVSTAAVVATKSTAPEPVTVVQADQCPAAGLDIVVDFLLLHYPNGAPRGCLTQA